MADLMLLTAAITVAAGIVIATIWAVTLAAAGRPPRRRRDRA